LPERDCLERFPSAWALWAPWIPRFQFSFGHFLVAWLVYCSGSPSFSTRWLSPPPPLSLSWSSCPFFFYEVLGDARSFHFGRFFPVHFTPEIFFVFLKGITIFLKVPRKVPTAGPFPRVQLFFPPVPTLMSEMFAVSPSRFSPAPAFSPGTVPDEPRKSPLTYSPNLVVRSAAFFEKSLMVVEGFFCLLIGLFLQSFTFCFPSWYRGVFAVVGGPALPWAVLFFKQVSLGPPGS